VHRVDLRGAPGGNGWREKRHEGESERDESECRCVRGAAFDELGNRVLEIRLGLLEDPLDAGMIRVGAKLGGELLCSAR
jgi:hypothetical protein